jgi:hypothetical protein
MTLFAFGLLPAPGCMKSFFGTHSPIIWGQVTHNGKPLRDGLITFTPEQAGVDDAMVPIRPDGTYRVAWSFRGQPLVTGWYRISVMPNRLRRVKPPRNETTPEESSEESPPPQAELSEIPVAYYEAKTSQLKIWVRPQSQKVDINLLD